MLTYGGCPPALRGGRRGGGMTPRGVTGGVTDDVAGDGTGEAAARRLAI